jgi:hypothetical protein
MGYAWNATAMDGYPVSDRMKNNNLARNLLLDPIVHVNNPQIIAMSSLDHHTDFCILRLQHIKPMDLFEDNATRTSRRGLTIPAH